MARFYAVFSMVVMVILQINGAPSNYRSMQDYEAMQLLQKLGLGNGGINGVPEVRVGEKKHPSDSPIFYIKLPPQPYFYAQNNMLQYQGPTTTPYPFQKVSVDFTNNGRPNQVYHWTQSGSHNTWTKPTTSTTTTPRTTTTTTTTPAPPPITKSPIKKPYFPSKPVSIVADQPWFPSPPVLPPAPSPPMTPYSPWLPNKPISSPIISSPSAPWYPTKPVHPNPWYLSNSLFAANGKPSSIYIYKPKQPINPAKYKSKKPKHSMFRHFNY